MQGFKGLVPRQVLLDQTFLPIHKKAEQNRKAAQVCIDFFHQIYKFFQSFSAVVQKSIQDNDVGDMKATYYRLIGFICTRLLKENKQLTQNTKDSSKQLTKVSNAILQDFSRFLQTFQSNIRKYQQTQLIVQQLSKKYFRSHKNMLNSIEAYKSSFTDVTLIYNMQQKIKRYQTCQSNYKIVTSQHSAISEKLQILNERKSKITQNSQQLKEQFTKVIKSIGSKVIGETKGFISYYIQTNKNIITFVAEQKYNLQKQQLSSFFSTIEDPSNPQIFNTAAGELKPSPINIPKIFEHPQLIKQQFLQSYNSQMLAYLKVIEDGVEKRKIQSKRINDLFNQYFKNLQKVHTIGVKDILQNFNLLKKKLTQSFGPRLVSFLKSINSIFQLLSGIDEKMVKNVSPKLNNVQQYINEQNKLLKLFYDQLKSNVEKFIGKKQLKKLKQDQFSEQGSAISNSKNYRKQITQKANFIKHLMQGFHEKMKTSCHKISILYTSIIKDLSDSINQFYSLCCQYQVLYFGPQQFSKNYEKYQSDVDSIAQKNKSFFLQLPFSILIGDTNKIIFDGEIGKVQDFKKIKKPVDNAPAKEEQTKDSRQVKSMNSQQKQQKSFQSDKSSKQKQIYISERQKSPKTGTLRSAESVPIGNGSQEMAMSAINKRQSSKQSLNVEQKQAKNFQFLTTKFKFKPNQQYIKSFSCALSTKLILHGRIYITTERICFSSGFNTSNLFFGKTFIQFPKQDITKIQKRSNALLMDNSISINTVKGEMFFTSFFSRDEAYNLICKTYGINMDDHVYQYEQVPQQINDQIIDIKQADDIKDTQLQSRKNQIQSQLSKFQYNEISRVQLAKQGLNAYQILKLFYGNNQIHINRRKYDSFLIYMKQQMGHKQVEIDAWAPGLQTVMNQSNIKSNSALKILRKIRAVVPVANSGVPFMPKTAKSQEVQSLYLFSKHKWMIEGQVSTSGAPYTDTFKVQIRTTVTSDQQGKCQISIGIFINFVKQTMMKSVIQSKSQQQSTKASKMWLDQIKKYLLSLQKKVKKQGVNPIDELRQQLQQKNSELDAIFKQKDDMKKQIEQLKQKNKKQQKIMLGLGVLCFLLFIILLT